MDVLFDEMVVSNGDEIVCAFCLEMNTGEKDLRKYQQVRFEIDTCHGFQYFLQDLNSQCPWFYDEHKDVDPEVIRDHEGTPYVIESSLCDRACYVALYLAGAKEWDMDLEDSFIGS
jgi:hypothetical protein